MCKNKTWKMEGDGGGTVTAGNIKRVVSAEIFYLEGSEFPVSSHLIISTATFFPSLSQHKPEGVSQKPVHIRTQIND